MPYNATEMFHVPCIPSFFEVLRKCIFEFSERISKNTNSITEACLSRQKIEVFSISLTTNHFMPIILLLLLIPLH